MNWKKIAMMIIPFILFAIGAQVGFILWLRPLYDRGIKWPTLIFGILASVSLALGLLPPYFELAKRRGRVVGINFWFIGIDCLGAFLSMLSVVVGNMDILGIVLYCICCALEIGIFLSHFIWCLRFKWLNKDYQDELEGDIKEEDIGLDNEKTANKKDADYTATSNNNSDDKTEDEVIESDITDKKSQN
ncbi:putative membrane protein [Wickerhamomyces ciferrii]|uniref:Membrane protein n=1 Tax=Wickerhamomyces ciferrii (strain ATCC 14091 / BCRC 22168 / CBS 111 / JCM 3599 / NBRC 0793 / NRRL Y-1031 F-60-10) TaxID=1206466 RepID=K0KSU4_WICCF|nr:uncharacterized protein BN7_5822 [Wickerhamomyces ciferrii]CCH46231.1 putative membrane protein [Wickerhamomyces ciferrii]